MTFLDALKWMSESEKNIALSPSGAKYTVKNGDLHYFGGNDGKTLIPTGVCYTGLHVAGWSKSEPAPQEVEVVAYLANKGFLTFAKLGSKKNDDLSKSNIWRKVKVRFT